MSNDLSNNCIQNKNTFSRKSCRLWCIVEKYGGTRGATNDAAVWRIRVACWVSRATREPACTRPRARSPSHPRARTHTVGMQCLLFFHGNNNTRTRLSVTSYAHCLSCYSRLHLFLKVVHWSVKWIGLKSFFSFWRNISYQIPSSSHSLGRQLYQHKALNNIVIWIPVILFC